MHNHPDNTIYNYVVFGYVHIWYTGRAEIRNGGRREGEGGGVGYLGGIGDIQEKLESIFVQIDRVNE